MYPQVRIDLNKIAHNTKVLVSVCDNLNIEVVGVVKACPGSIEVARAMMKGGVSIIGDSRLENLERLSTLNAPLMMLRQPMSWEVPQAVEITDFCLVSELKTIEEISEAAGALGKNYRLIIMVETGDLREGVLPEDLFDFAKAAMGFPWIKLEGIGSNVACLQGVPPTPAMLDLLVKLASDLRQRLKIELPVISGGNSSAWKLLEAGSIPQGVNQFRLGEAILLGQETINLDPIPGTYQDAFILEAEIIEVKDKPKSRFITSTSKRAILALGVQDICRGELKPLDNKVQVLRRSSDHLVVDVTDSNIVYKVGDFMSFIPSYEAMVAAMTSPFVKKKFFEKPEAANQEP
ncbi:MAG: alanine/ornithine racemase family PLP-dependent enzyme [Firmicutes bacterium]|nr:alanine/ornithine racemase family PLP-dependent enzyme [Bacillota bacterium]